MRPVLQFALCLLCTLIASAAFAQRPADELLGQWYTEDDASKVLVRKENGKYFGRIIWIAEPRYVKPDPDAGKIKHDRKNKEKKLRKRKIVGLQVLKSFSYDAGDKEWDAGTIYDPEVGKIYKCVIKFENDAKAEGGKILNVRGYIGIPTLGRTTVWTRVPQDELETLD